jgi:predicted nucleotidyltransferase
MNREEQILDWIRNGIRQYAGDLVGYQIVLFGSRVGRNHRERSDFDIGVCGSSPLPFRTFDKISDFLDGLPTLYRIDWVDLNRASPSVKTEALKNAVVLYGQ